MMEEKSYQLPEDHSGIVSEPSPSGILHERQIKDLRHHVMDAVYASDDANTLRVCLFLLQNQVHPSKKVFYERLAELAKLPAGWDGAESKPISKKVLAFMDEVLAAVDGKILTDWVLFPDARGYLYWDYTQGKNIAGITIAENEAVAFTKLNGQLKKYQFDTLKVSDILKVLEEVNG